MAKFNQLSDREWEVIRQLLQGKSNKIIALSLDISISTVEFHLNNIYAKLEVSSRLELILVLWKATGKVEVDELRYSTVDSLEDSVENKDQFTIDQLRGLRSIMRLYRLVLITCLLATLLPLGILFYTASFVPGSIIMWRYIFLWLLPAAAIIFLLLLFPRTGFRTLIFIAYIIFLPFLAITFFFRLIGPLWLIPFLVGAGGILIAARSRKRDQDASTLDAD